MRSLRLHSGFACALARFHLAAAAGLVVALPAVDALAQTAPVMVAQAGGKLAWSDLNPAQKNALAPLAGKWETFPADQKIKWVEIANKYPGMKPGEQARVQERMREWAALTPEQRHQARENFQRSKSVPRDTKQQQWEQYQALPEEKKRALAEKAAAEKTPAPGLPSPSKPGDKPKS